MFSLAGSGSPSPTYKTIDLIILFFGPSLSVTVHGFDAVLLQDRRHHRADRRAAALGEMDLGTVFYPLEAIRAPPASDTLSLIFTLGMSANVW